MPFGKTAKTRTQFVRDELGQSFGHFRSAATHAAQGAAERIGPRVDSTMMAVGLRKPPKRSRWPWVAAAIGATAVAGVAVLAVVKRRRGEWEDYSVSDAAGDLREAGSDAADKAKELASDAGAKAKDLAGKAQNKAEDLTGKARDTAGQLADKAGGIAERASDKVRSGGFNTR